MTKKNLPAILAMGAMLGAEMSDVPTRSRPKAEKNAFQRFHDEMRELCKPRTFYLSPSDRSRAVRVKGKANVRAAKRARRIARGADNA